MGSQNLGPLIQCAGDYVLFSCPKLVFAVLSLSLVCVLCFVFFLLPVVGASCLPRFLALLQGRSDGDLPRGAEAGQSKAEGGSIGVQDLRRRHPLQVTTHAADTCPAASASNQKLPPPWTHLLCASA